ncbi:MAG TPA: HAMP domain-containing sensor histidine kinase [Thermoanaerobaculia bacterium]|nr:HAMP domain-containing sensor histidine kinase [Thermoanaerobaculia bacterium]
MPNRVVFDEAAPSRVVERRSAERLLQERILVLAPTGDDAGLVSEILLRRGLNVDVVAGAGALAEEIHRGAAVVLVASEALDEAGSGLVLQQALERQEPWSEMPVILFGGDVEDAASGATELLGTRAQIVLLERPLGIATFVTATEAALRSRRRQYEVKRLLDALAESAAQIAHATEAATRAKDEFLATLGHELRSPMAAIRGWIQLLQEDALGAEDAAAALSMIDSSTKVQARIIEDLMDVSRIMAGKVMIEPSRIALAPVVERVVTTFQTSAVLEGIELTADISSEPLFAWADETRLQQVGWNLISNAIKFTPRGGSVHVTLARENGAAVIRVRDTGKGISPELLPHVFERYRQEEGDEQKSHKGLGLGLAIVRHLVESHGGTIQAFSDGAGKGAELVASLPLVD